MKTMGYHLSVDKRNYAFLRVVLFISFFLHWRAQRYSTCRSEKTAQAKAIHLSSFRLASRYEAGASTWNWKAWFLLSADNWYPIFLSLWKAGDVLLRHTCCWVKRLMLKTQHFFLHSKMVEETTKTLTRMLKKSSCKTFLPNLRVRLYSSLIPSLNAKTLMAR